MANSKHRVSLKDLAQELNVSIATVSRALHSSPEIGKEMQQRVKDLAKRLPSQSLCTESAQGGPEGHWRRRAQLGHTLLCCRPRRY